jgi:hypothetical protein
MFWFKHAEQMHEATSIEALLLLLWLVKHCCCGLLSIAAVACYALLLWLVTHCCCGLLRIAS